MVSIGMLGVNHRTADLDFRELIARGASHLHGEKACFFPHPTVLLSTCNRTEIYFSADDLAEAHTDLLASLRLTIDCDFEQHFYSFFGIDCFFHLCRVAAGLDSAILAETEIQRQVRVAYAKAKDLPSALHYVFQKALKVSKDVRRCLQFQRGSPTLYGMLWQLASWKNKRVLLVGYSEINRGLISFLTHKGVTDLSLCTRSLLNLWVEGVRLVGRDALEKWQEYEIIVCASSSDEYLIQGEGETQVIFDLSVPRNVDPNVKATLYNIEQVGQLIKRQEGLLNIEQCEDFIWENVLKLIRIYQAKQNRSEKAIS